MWEYLVYIFKRGDKFYVCPHESEDEAWKSLASRQSMSLERVS